MQQYSWLKANTDISYYCYCHCCTYFPIFPYYRKALSYSFSSKMDFIIQHLFLTLTSNQPNKQTITTPPHVQYLLNLKSGSWWSWIIIMMLERVAFRSKYLWWKRCPDHLQRKGKRKGCIPWNSLTEMNCLLLSHPTL